MIEMTAKTQPLFTALKIQLEAIKKLRITDTCLVSLYKGFLFFQTKSSIIPQSKVAVSNNSDNFEVVIHVNNLIAILADATEDTSIVVSSSGLVLSVMKRSITLPSIDIRLDLFKRDDSEKLVDSINPKILLEETKFLLNTAPISKALGRVTNFDFTSDAASVCYATTYFHMKSSHNLNLSLSPDTTRFLQYVLSTTLKLDILLSDSYTALRGENFKIYFPLEDFTKVDVIKKLKSMQHITTINSKEVKAWVKTIFQSTPKDSLYISIHDQAISLNLQSDTCSASMMEGDCSSPALSRLHLPLDISHCYFSNFSNQIKVWKGETTYGFSDERVTIIFTSL